MIRKLHLKADRVLNEAERLLPFGLVNPENADTIKKRFLRRPFEPEFEYAQMPDTQVIRDALKNLKTGRTKPGRLLAKEKESVLAKSRMTDLIGGPFYADACRDVYGLPDKTLVKKALALLDLPTSPKDKKIKAEKVRDIMKQTFKLLGFSYTVKRAQLVTSAAVSPASKTVTLKKKERFGHLYAYRLAIHEIGTHALRAENGRLQDLPIFSRGTPDYLATEEGLAAYNEERAGVMTTDILRNYAGRVVAVDLAQHGTFVETYKGLREFFDKETAFKLALRAKRGLGNGEQLGGCTKDHVYLKGYLGIKDYVASGKDIRLLYAGKISLEDVPEWGKKLRAPQYFPEPVIDWIRHERLTQN